LERHRLREQRPDSFAETHAKLAKESADRLNSLGENLFQVFQSELFLPMHNLELTLSISIYTSYLVFLVAWQVRTFKYCNSMAHSFVILDGWM
jgi:hypothetical protein